MRDAISLFELCASEDHRVDAAQVRAVAGVAGRETSARIASAVITGQLDVIFTEIAEIFNSSKDITAFWQELVSFYRDMLVLKSINDAVTYLDLTAEEYEETRAVAARFTRGMLLWHCSLLDDAYVSMQRNIVSKRLCAEFTLIRMAQKPDDTPAALAARVAALEEALASLSFKSSAAPLKQGKVIHGLTVYDANGTLPEICRSKGIAEILVSSREIPEEKLADIRTLCGELNISLKRAQIKIEPID
jgi:DNA polymerase-3 subunit gamma/tau